MGRMTQDKSSRIMRYEDGNNPAFLNLLALAVITGINCSVARIEKGSLLKV